MNTKNLVNVVMFGAGKYGETIYHRTSGKIFNIIGVADNNKSIVTWYDAPLINIKDIVELYKNKRINGVIIAVKKHCFYDEIKKVLCVSGVPVIAIPTFEYKTSNISAIDISTSSMNANGVNVYVVEDCNVKIDSMRKCAWVYKDGKTIKENFSYEWQNDSIIPSFNLDTSDSAVVVDELVNIYKYWTINYWHFIFEGFERILRMEEIGYKGKYLVPDTKFAREMIEFAEIESERIIWAKDDDDEKVINVKKMYLFEIYKGQAELSASSLYNWAEKVADRLFDKDCLYENYPSKVFVKRIGKRKLTDKNELFIKNNGYKVIVPENLSVIEQWRYFRRADVVFCPHGANSSNVLFMRDGTKFIESFPNNYINPCCLNIITQKKLDYHMVVEPLWLDNGEDKEIYEISEQLLRVVL